MALNIGIGLSTLEDPYIAGVQAAKEARKGIDKPDLALVFASIHLEQKELLSGIRTQLDARIILGGTSYAEISNAGVTKRSVVIALLSFKEADVHFTHGELQSQEEELGKKLGSTLRNLCKEKGLQDRAVAFLLRDIGKGNAGRANKGIFDTLGRLPIFGGIFTGDYDLGINHPEFWTNYQFIEDRVVRNSAGLALVNFSSKQFRPAFGFEHGWNPVGPEVVLNKCDGNKVFEVDGIPIFDYYQQFLSSHANEEFFRSMIQRYGFSITYQCEQARFSVIRLPVACNFEEGYIEFFPVQNLQGQKVRLIQASRTGVLEGARKAAVLCKEGLLGYKPAFVFVVSCCMRASILHSRINSEFEVIQEVFGKDVPIFGYYSGGELVPFLNKYEDIIDEKNRLWGSFYHASTVGIMALGTKSPCDMKRFPGREKKFLPQEKEVKRLRKLLKESEGILDDTQDFLTSLSRKSYESGEKLKEQNEELQRKNEHNLKLQEVVHRYTPHEIWQKVGESVARGEYELAESECFKTFMFMDIKGFTSYSEEHPSSEVVRTLNDIFKPATEIIYQHEGDVDKYIGDCIFAVFDNEKSAVTAGQFVLKLFKDLEKKGLPFSLRIGINSGRAIRGNVGSTERREYTFIGDAVNVAQRLESNCTPGKILISEEAFNNAGIEFSSVEKKEVSMKGKKLPQTAYECMP
ncbi:FIST N-terminal domain-containing protein [Candidatus Riflebacteria bacterium]